MFKYSRVSVTLYAALFCEVQNNRDIWDVRRIRLENKGVGGSTGGWVEVGRAIRKKTTGWLDQQEV